MKSIEIFPLENRRSQRSIALVEEAKYGFVTYPQSKFIKCIEALEVSEAEIEVKFQRLLKFRGLYEAGSPQHNILSILIGEYANP